MVIPITRANEMSPLGNWVILYHRWLGCNSTSRKAARSCRFGIFIKPGNITNRHALKSNPVENLLAFHPRSSQVWLPVCLPREFSYPRVVVVDILSSRPGPVPQFEYVNFWPEENVNIAIPRRLCQGIG